MPTRPQPQAITLSDRRQIGERLKSVRLGLNETRDEFSKRLSMTSVGLYNYETGLNCPRADQLLSLVHQDIDGAFVVTGHPSLALSANRKSFSSVLGWVRQEAYACNLELSARQEVEIAWEILCVWTDRTSEASIARVQAITKTALATFRVGAHEKHGIVNP